MARNSALGRPPVLIIPLIEDELVETDGTTNYTHTVISGEKLHNMGAYIKALQVHGACKGRSANFEFKITGQWSFNGLVWVDFDADIYGPQATNAPFVSTSYADLDDFGIHIRIRVSAHNTTGSAIESARISAVAVVDLKA